MSIHKIAAKLTVLCAVLDPEETPGGTSRGRLATALQLAREASALAASEQARLEAGSDVRITRTAMLTEPMLPADPNWLDLSVVLDMTPEQLKVYRPLLHVDGGVRITVEPASAADELEAIVRGDEVKP